MAEPEGLTGTFGSSAGLVGGRRRKSGARKSGYRKTKQQRHGGDNMYKVKGGKRSSGRRKSSRRKTKQQRRGGEEKKGMY
jgi:hypothetical protein